MVFIFIEAQNIKMILENEEAQKHIRHIFQDTKSIVQFYSSAIAPHAFKVVLVYLAWPTSVQQQHADEHSSREA